MAYIGLDLTALKANAPPDLFLSKLIGPFETGQPLEMIPGLVS